VQGLIKALQGALADVASRRPEAIGAVETRKPRQWSRATMLTVCVLGIVLAGSAGVWFAKPYMSPVAQETISAQSAPASVQPAPPAPAESTLAPAPPAALPIQATTASAQAPVTPVQPASSIVEPPPTGNAAEVPGSPDAASFEVAFWNSIKDAKDPQLFEAYLKRYPNGAFVDIVKINLEKLKIAAAKPIDAAPDDRAPISDPGLLREVHDRLYELNFDPGPPDANGLKPAIREFEAQSKLAQTGEVTQGLLTRLREIGGLKPWGAIVYDKSAGKWGMAWDQPSRKEAVASAQSQCGTTQCAAEVSFFGIACGAFATSGASWSMASRDNIQDARQAALDGCGKSGKACRIIGASCADGAGRTTPGN
jgi:hypothetical protein